MLCGVCGVVGHMCEVRSGTTSSTGLSSPKSLMSSGTLKRGSGRRPEGEVTINWLLGVGGRDSAERKPS